jgi:Spy/CpxP family protein refolding chaperone
MQTIIFKTLFVSGVFLSAFIAPVFSQELDLLQKPRKTVEEIATTQTEEMSTRLELTPEQNEKIAAINLDFAKKKKEAKDRHAPEQEFKVLYETRDDSLQSVLTTKQFVDWKEDPLAKKNQEGKDKQINKQN